MLNYKKTQQHYTGLTVPNSLNHGTKKCLTDIGAIPQRPSEVSLLQTGLIRWIYKRKKN